jgi:hypothetical protein
MKRLSFGALCLVACSAASSAEFQFKDQELPTRLTVGYAVRLIDMNGDGRLDIAIVDSDRILWLENPRLERACHFAGPDEKGQRMFRAGRHQWRPADRFFRGGGLAAVEHEVGRDDSVD